MNYFKRIIKPLRLEAKFFIVLFCLEVAPICAEEVYLHNANIFGIGPRYSETSEELQYFELFANYRNHRRDMDWPFEEADSLNLDWGIDTVVRTGSSFSEDFEALAFAAFVGKRLPSGSYLQGRVGFHGVRGDDFIEDSTIPTYKVKGQFEINPAFDVGIETEFDFIYPEGYQTGSLEDALKAHTITGKLSWKPHSRLSVKSVSAFKFISDSNNTFSTDFAVLYGISPEWPWIWAGAGVYYQTFEHETENYWSPSGYLAYGPRLDAYFPIISRLDGWSSIQINVVSEDDIFEEVGDYVSLGLDFAITDKTHILFEIARFDSVRDGDHYYENSVFLSLNWPLP